MSLDTLSTFTYAETAALASAARRFLGERAPVRHADTPDRAGFRRLYGRHFKSHP